ncbi:MAG: hypothetical protein ACI31G_00110 [Bacilli bacterium]
MKLDKMFVLFGMLGISFVAAGTVAYIHNEVETPVKAEAATDTDSYSDYVFFKPNSNWLSDSAWFAVYSFSSSSNEWTKLSNNVEINGYKDSNYYIAKLPHPTWTHVFCRMNPNDNSCSWSAKWNQTGNIEGMFDSTNNYNCFSMNDGSWDSGTASRISYLSGDASREVYVKSSFEPYVYAYIDGGYGNNSWPGIKAEEVSSGLYRAMIDTSYDKITINNNGSGQTANISLINKYAVSTNGNIQGYTVASDYSYSYGLISESSMNTNNFVLWLYRNGHYASGYSYAFHYWNDSGVNHEIFPNYSSLNHTEWHAKYVIPAEAIGCNSQFKLYSSSGSFVAASETVTFESSFNNGEAQVTAASSSSISIGYSLKSTNSSSASVAAKILSNYYTCLANDYNGYKQIENILTNWGIDTSSTDLDTTMIDDFSSVSDYESGTKSNSVSVKDKITEMQNMASIASAQSAKLTIIGNVTSSTAIVTIVTIVSLVSLVVITIYIIRKRYNKQANN